MSDRYASISFCVFGIVALATGCFAASAPPDLLARSQLAMQSGNFGQACAILRPASDRFADDVNVWNLLGICESELNHTAQARAAFARGLKLAPDSVSLLENGGLLEFRLRAYTQSKKLLRRAAKLGDNNPGAAFSLAASEVRTGETREGLADLRRLEPALSSQAAYWTERGWVEWELQQRADAAASFDRALALDQNDARALNGAASCAEAANDDEKALSFLLRAKAAAPHDAKTLLHFGSVCLRRDLTVDAMDALKRAYEMQPQNNLALFLYARANISVEQWETAHQLFAEFEKRVPRYAPAEFALGWLDVKLNRTAEARGHLERALALDPELVDARYQLGQLDLDEDRRADAQRELQRVLARAPKHVQANIALGDVLMRNADLAGAKAHYETAIAADPDSGPAHYKLSLVLRRQHEFAAAEREGQLGAKLNAEATAKSKTVLLLANPDGELLTGTPQPLPGVE